MLSPNARDKKYGNQTEEYENGEFKGEIGEILIRCNNVLYGWFGTHGSYIICGTYRTRWLTKKINNIVRGVPEENAAAPRDVQMKE